MPRSKKCSLNKQIDRVKIKVKENKVKVKALDILKDIHIKYTNHT